MNFKNLLISIIFLAVCTQARIGNRPFIEKEIILAKKTLHVLVNGTAYGDSSSDIISNFDQLYIKPSDDETKN